LFDFFRSKTAQLSLFDNNPYASGEQREYKIQVTKEEKEGCFGDFHVGIVTLNKKHYRKSDKLRALLSYISQHAEVMACCVLSLSTISVQPSFFTLLVYNILSCGSVLLICVASVLGYIQCSMATFPVISPMLWCICAGFISRRFHAAINVFKSIFQRRFFGCAQV
jgi:hypothetical protein